MNANGSSSQIGLTSNSAINLLSGSLISMTATSSNMSLRSTSGNMGIDASNGNVTINANGASSNIGITSSSAFNLTSGSVINMTSTTIPFSTQWLWMERRIQTMFLTQHI